MGERIDVEVNLLVKGKEVVETAQVTPGDRYTMVDIEKQLLAKGYEAAVTEITSIPALGLVFNE